MCERSGDGADGARNAVAAIAVSTDANTVFLMINVVVVDSLEVFLLRCWCYYFFTRGCLLRLACSGVALEECAWCVCCWRGYWRGREVVWREISFGIFYDVLLPIYNN
jgi:hypothetical protein